MSIFLRTLKNFKLQIKCRSSTKKLDIWYHHVYSDHFKTISSTEWGMLQNTVYSHRFCEITKSARNSSYLRIMLHIWLAFKVRYPQHPGNEQNRTNKSSHTLTMSPPVPHSQKTLWIFHFLHTFFHPKIRFLVSWYVFRWFKGHFIVDMRYARK